MGTLTRSALLRRTAGSGAASLLAACGAGTAAPGAGVTKETVRLNMFNHAGDQAAIDQWKQVVEPFSQKYPNVTFDVGGAARRAEHAAGRSAENGRRGDAGRLHLLGAVSWR